MNTTKEFNNLLNLREKLLKDRTVDPKLVKTLVNKINVRLTEIVKLVLKELS